MTDDTPSLRFGPVLRVADLAKGEERAFVIEPDADSRAAIAEALDLIALRKLRLEGTLAPLGKRDWRLAARLGATVVQPCVVSLAPVTSRVEEAVSRTYIAGLSPPEGEEVEIIGDVDDEPLGTEIDLGAVMVEALALALPLYPHAEGAEPLHSQVTEPGKVAMTDDDARPFAGLAGLRDKLAGGDDTG